jgi:glyoxylate/hydroxypyruvate reductase A
MTICFLSQLPIEEVTTWLAALRAAAPAEQFFIGPPHASWDEGVRAGVDLAVVANPPRGMLAQLPNLQMIQSAWAGVDGLLADPGLPATPRIARLVDPALAQAMSEAVLAHVLALHRQAPLYREQQLRREWRQLPQPLAAERRVGVLGLGAIGGKCAQALAAVGFEVLGWSRHGTPLDGVRTMSGASGLVELLAASEIVVNVLPLTRETRGILNARAFATMPFGSALVNVGRGPHLVTADLLDALSDGQLWHAVLDVFEHEPLPNQHPFWKHPAITILPHVAAITDPRTAAPCIGANIERFRAGAALAGEVAREAGY